MDITTEPGTFFDNHPRRKNAALILEITIANPCVSSNLENAASHAGKQLADAVERKKNKCRGSFPASYALLPLAMSTCGKTDSDLHAFIKELTIRRIEHRLLEIHSNESRHLAEGTEVARLRRRFLFVLQQALSFRTRHSLCRQGVALVGIRLLRSQGLVYVHAHCPEGVSGSEGRERASGVVGGIVVGGGKGDGNGVGNGDRNGAGTGMGVEASERTQDGSGDGSVDGVGTGTGTGVETRERTQDGNGDRSGDGNGSSSGDGDGARTG